MIRLAALALLFATPALAREPLAPRVAAELAKAGPGPRYGLVVADDTGREIVALDPDGRYMPASNTKMFTTAAAFDTLYNLDRPDDAGGTAVQVEGDDVVLAGRGDARLSSAPDCVTDCLAKLADAVVRERRRVRDVIGDDSLFPDERWSPGMSWNNIGTVSGTGVSALTLDDNEARLTVTPAAVGARPVIAAESYFTIDNRAVTVAAGGDTRLTVDRAPLARTLRIAGTIAAGSAPRTLTIGVDDPAERAAWRFADLLRTRGVTVTGSVRARHRDPLVPPAVTADLFRIGAAPLLADITTINKRSQNLHAELLLRRIGLTSGQGSLATGLAAVRAMMTRAGVQPWGYDVSDGSGMSTYNRITPRAAVAFLRWTQTRPWGAAWRATLPVGGVDGTLARRFIGTPLAGRIFAKTGSLNGTSALSGFLIAASGRTLTFSALANDVPAGVAASAAVDRALVLIAAEN